MKAKKGNKMLQLEHLNLVVRDMKQTLEFYQAAFPHWKIRCQGEGEWYGVYRHWLHFGDDYQYLSFNDNGQGENKNLQSNDMGLSHFAFVTSNLDDVILRLKLAGFVVDKQGGNSSYRKNCYYLDPNGYEVEFVEYLSDLPEQRNG